MSQELSNLNLSLSDIRQESRSGSAIVRSRRYLSELVQRMRPFLKSVAREHAPSVPDCKEDDSDIVQGSLVKAWENAHKFDGQNTAQWCAWLVAIVTNTAKDRYRYWKQDKRDYGHEERDSHVIGSLEDHNQSTPSKVMQAAEGRQLLEAAMASLSIQEQQLVRWREFDSLTYREIAERLGVTEPTASRRCEAAFKTLRETMTLMGA